MGAVQVFPGCSANIEHPCEGWEPDSAQPGLPSEPRGPAQPRQGYGQIMGEMLLYEQLIKGIVLFLSHLICFLLPSSF